MSLKKKLVYRSTLLFFATTSVIIVGTYLLYKHSTDENYRKKLLATALLAGEFYLEKDELTDSTHKKIEKRFNRIADESIQLFDANTKKTYVQGTAGIPITDEIISNTRTDEVYAFNIGERQFLSLFYEDNEGDFIILVSGLNLNGKERVKMLVQMLFLFGLIGLLLHFLLAWILANRTFKPFHHLVTQVNLIKEDDWHVRLLYPGKKDEISELIDEFNYLLDRVEKSFTIQRDFLRNASHEIKTPLAIIIGDIEVALQNTRTPDEYQQLLLGLKASSLHLKTIIESLLALANLEVTDSKLAQDVRIDEVIWDILSKKEIEYPGRKVNVHFLADNIKEDQLTVKSNRDLLMIAIANIIDNALKFSTPEPIEIRFDVVNTQLVISIVDFGPGMADAEVAQNFKLFYRSPKSSHIPGHGIGLYLAAQIFKINKISIRIKESEPAGTTVDLTFPDSNSPTEL